MSETDVPAELPANVAGGQRSRWLTWLPKKWQKKWQPTWRSTLSLGVLAVWIGLLTVHFTDSWDDIGDYLSEHSRFVVISFTFIVIMVAINYGNWAGWWSFIKSRKANQTAIVLVLVTTLVAIVVARIEEKRDLETATIFLFVGLMSAWFAKNALDLKDNVLYVAILLVPLVAYLALTGRLSVVELPGGGTVEFEDVGQEQLQSDALALAFDRGPFKTINLGNSSCDPSTANTAADFSFEPATEGQEVLIIFPRAAATIAPGGLLTYLRQYPSFRYFVVVNADCQPVGSGRVEALMVILTTADGTTFLGDAANGQPSLLAKYPGVSTATIVGNPTVAEAMSAFEAQNVDLIAVVGSEVGRLEGIIDRDEVVNQALLGVLGVPTAAPTSTPAPSPTPTARTG